MQSVIDKILEEAKKEAETIARMYESEEEKIRKEYAEKIAEAENRLNEEIDKRKKETIMQTVAQTRLLYNKKLTTEMQAYIEDVLQSAVKKLPEHKKYFDFLKGLIKNSGVKDGELYLSSGDLKKYRNQLEKFLYQEGYDFQIKADDNLSGGLVIKKEKTTFLGSLDVITEIMRDELKIEIARILGFV